MTAPFCAKTPTAKSKFDTQHTVLLVGWDDDYQDQSRKKGFFLRVQSSWGTVRDKDPTEAWDGYFWMPYDWITVGSPLEDHDEKPPKRHKMASTPWVLVDR
jgi:C1A family cysteine protease